jgi:putative ABC transport system substrate-binding protein
MRKLKILIVVLILCGGLILIREQKAGDESLPLVAIANYGPHASLSAAIAGFKKGMEKNGFIEGETIRYTIADVNFSQTLIPQMLLGLLAKNPKAMLVLTTPVSETANRMVTHIPLIYTVVTNPVEAGLIPQKYKASNNMSGSSDSQNLQLFFNEVKRLLPNAKTVGLIYATSESNDLALVREMERVTHRFNMTVLAVPVDEARDIPLRMEMLKRKVDFLYVGASGPIQPSLPAISAIAKKMGIPIFNVESDAVEKGLALASISVDYEKVGFSAGRLMSKALQGSKVSDLTPRYPHSKDVHRVINRILAKELALHIPTGFVEVSHD